MFERYNHPARRTLFFSRYEASHLGSVAIETEHLLLGLTREAGPIVGKLFAEADISYDGVLKEIQAAKGQPKSQIPTSVEIPFTSETKHVLQYAAEEADLLEHDHIGPEHLLLGLLRERGTVAEQILAQKRLSADPARKHIRAESVASPSSSESTKPSVIEAHMALGRATYLLKRIDKAVDDDIRQLVASIRLELELVSRALHA
jgi:ATP-dependent Clp protease ATP-binding subunit ClpA